MSIHVKADDDGWVLERFQYKEEQDLVRLIVFEKDPETGARSVKDIWEVDAEHVIKNADCFAFNVIEIGGWSMDGAKIRRNWVSDCIPIDFGKAKREDTKMRKILEQLLALEMEEQE